MYRPSDEEIAAVAQVLKDYMMPSGWQTAAVLALDAAGKVRAPKKMKKRNDEQMTRFLDGVQGAIDATSEEYLGIWSRNKENSKHTWESNNSGLIETVGYLDERPIAIDLRTAVIKGSKILFYNGCSQLVDHAMINEWLKLNLSEKAFNNKTDATNWHNVLPR